MSTRWILRPVADEGTVPHVSAMLNHIPLPLARALVLRGITTFEGARAFFRPSLDYLHDPFLMKDMDRAAERLARAITHQERVLVYGDYDVDGTTATALMTSFLRAFGVQVQYFVPNRFIHGYGLCTAGLDYASDLKAGLVVALDCGITAHAQARYAKELGLDLIICDHHKAEEVIPDAYAVLDPKRHDCAYPFKELSGCGIGFKLAQATLTQLGRKAEEAYPLLDLVAVSTAADIVPLVGENRHLMAAGLDRLRTAPRIGLHALAENTSTSLEAISTEGIIFQLGPRINAAGRLGEASRAVELLLETNPNNALQAALQLEEINMKRRELDQKIQQEAILKAEELIESGKHHAVALYDPSWHLGVIGIVASRVVEQFYKPAIMMCRSGDLVKGSARSVAGISIYNALSACSDLLVAFGGHDFAAGLTLKEDKVEAFQQRFNEAVADATDPNLLTPVTEVDATLHLSELTPRFLNVLKQFSPFGPENLMPVFQANDLVLYGKPRIVGKDNAHLKFAVRHRDGQGGTVDVIAYRMGKRFSDLMEADRAGRPIDMVFTVSENEYRGNVTLQLKVQDFRLSEA